MPSRRAVRLEGTTAMPEFPGRSEASGDWVARTAARQASGRLELKNSAWLIAVRTVASLNGLVTR